MSYSRWHWRTFNVLAWSGPVIGYGWRSASALRHFALASRWAVLVAEICWFALLHPRIAGNFRTVLALALLPLTAVGYVYLMAAVSAYLADREWDLRLRQMIVIMLGLSVGCFVFAVLWLTKVHFEGELG